MYLKQKIIRIRIKSNRDKMDYSEDFKYDEISVFSENGTQYCTPVWAFQNELNVKVSNGSVGTNNLNSFKNWAQGQKFPLLCSFEIPNGVYSAYLFKVCEDSEKFFGIDISHYEYKGKNPAQSTMKSQVEECPFDEILPVPKKETEIFGELARALQSECAHLESLIKGHINEASMRKMNTGRIENFQFNFPKYLYN